MLNRLFISQKNLQGLQLMFPVHCCDFSKHLFSDLVLNMQNVTNKLKPVTEWHDLGIQLGVPDYQLSQIESNYSRDRCKSEMLSYWFRNADDQSWHVIADALEKIHYCKLANEIRRGPSDGMYVC